MARVAVSDCERVEVELERRVFPGILAAQSEASPDLPSPLDYTKHALKALGLDDLLELAHRLYRRSLLNPWPCPPLSHEQILYVLEAALLPTNESETPE